MELENKLHWSMIEGVLHYAGLQSEPFIHKYSSWELLFLQLLCFLFPFIKIETALHKLFSYWFIHDPSITNEKLTLTLCMCDSQPCIHTGQ